MEMRRSRAVLDASSGPARGPVRFPLRPNPPSRRGLGTGGCPTMHFTWPSNSRSCSTTAPEWRAACTWARARGRAWVARERPDNKAQAGSPPRSLGAAPHYGPSSKAVRTARGPPVPGRPRRAAHPNESGLLILQTPRGFLFPKTHFGAFKDDKSSGRELSRLSPPFFSPSIQHA